MGLPETGQTGVLVPEAFLPVRQSVEILGAGMKPGIVRALLAECLKCLKHTGDWNMRKQAADTLAVLAASTQVASAHPHDKEIARRKNMTFEMYTFFCR